MVLQKAKVLIVESNVRDRGLLEVALKKAGFSVATTSTPEEALNILDIFMPDIIISNTRFPRMDGFEFCKRVKEDPRFKHIPFVFLTPDKSLNSKIKGLELGADDYLVKPLYLRELVMRAKILIDKKEKENIELVDNKKLFTGNLEDMGLVDLIQTMELGRKTGIIYLYRGGKVGKIYFKTGRLIHAMLGDVVGDEAVYRLFTWGEGTFKIEFRDIGGIEETITLSTQALLMEGMRRLDEIERYKEQLPPLDTRLEVDNQAVIESKIEKFPRDVEEVMLLFDGHRTIGDVLEETKLDQVKAIEIISKLYFEGFLIPVAEDKEKTGSFAISQFDLFDHEDTEVSTPPEIPPEELFSDAEDDRKEDLFELAPPEEETGSREVNVPPASGGTPPGGDKGKVIPFPAAAAEAAPLTFDEEDEKKEVRDRPEIAAPSYVKVETGRKGGWWKLILGMIIVAVGGYAGYKYWFSAKMKPPEVLVYKEGIEEFYLDTAGGYRAASEFFKKMKDMYPDDWRVDYFLGLTFVRWGELSNDDQMIDRGWKKLVQLDNQYANNPYIRGAYAEAQMVMRNFAEAEKIAEKSAEKVSYYQFYYVLGDSMFREYDTGKEVEGYLLKSVKLNPDFVRGYVELGKLYFMRGDFDSSLKMLSRAVQLSPEHVEAYVYMGRAHYRKGDYALAVNYLEKALDFEKSPSVALLIGKIYVENLKAPSRGMVYLRKLWKSARSPMVKLEAGYLLAKAYMEMGNDRRALALLKQIYDINPDYKDIRDLLDRASGKKKVRRTTTVETQRKVVRQPASTGSTNLADEYLKLGIAAYKREDLELAYSYLSKAIQLAPSNYRAYLALGQVLEDMGRVREAIRAFLKVVYLKPDNPDAHLHLGGLYYSLGRKKFAIKEYKEYLRLAPYGQHADEVRKILEGIGG